MTELEQFLHGVQRKVNKTTRTDLTWRIVDDTIECCYSRGLLPFRVNIILLSLGKAALQFHVGDEPSCTHVVVESDGWPNLYQPVANYLNKVVVSAKTTEKHYSNTLILFGVGK